MNIDNAVVIMTGAGSRIGAAAARAASAAGAHLVLAGRRRERINAVADGLRAARPDRSRGPSWGVAPPRYGRCGEARQNGRQNSVTRLSWVGGYGCAVLRLSGVLPVVEGGGDEGLRHPCEEVDGLVAG